MTINVNDGGINTALTGINRTSQRDVCFNKPMVRASQTAWEFVQAVCDILVRSELGIDNISQDCNVTYLDAKNLKNNLDLLSRVQKTFDSFRIGREPITTDNRDELIKFLQNPEVVQLSDKMISRLGLMDYGDIVVDKQTGTTHSEFLQETFYSYGKRTTSHMREFIIQELKNYPFVFDVDIEENGQINKMKSIDSVGTYYNYKGNDGYYHLVLIKDVKTGEDVKREIVYFKDEFDFIPELLVDGMIFANQKVYESQNAWTSDAPEDAPQSHEHYLEEKEGVVKGVLYEMKDDKLVKIYEKEGVKDVNRLFSPKYICGDGLVGKFYATTSVLGKMQIIGVYEYIDKEIKVTEYGDRTYDRVYEWDGVLIEEDYYEDEKGISCKEVILVRPIGGLSDVLSYDAYHNGRSIDVNHKFFDDGKICGVRGLGNKISFHRFDENTKTYLPIEGLQRFRNIPMASLEEIKECLFTGGVLPIVNKDGNYSVLVYDNENDRGVNILSSNKEIEVESGFCVSVGNKYFWYLDGRLYTLDNKYGVGLPKGSLFEKYIYRKIPFTFGVFGNNTHARITASFDEIKQFLKEIPLGIVVN